MAEDKTALGLPRNTTAALAYLLGWVSGLVVFLVEKEDKLIRFHALQSIVTFGFFHLLVMIPLIGWMVSPLVGLISLATWVYCLVKAYQGEKFLLPVVGELVEKQLGKMI